MEKIYSFFIKVLILGILYVPFSLRAALLDEDFDLKQLEGAKIGYYVGSFDPLHLGHQQVIDTALEQGYVDYVLVYPVHGGDHFKNRVERPLRQKMIESVYQKHPKVLLTSWTPKQLQDRFSEQVQTAEILGIIGSDVVTDTFLGPDKERSEKYQKVFMRGIPLSEKHYTDTIGAIMALKATSFIVTLRGDIDLSYLQGRVIDRPIRAFIQSTDHSSTKVRQRIKEKGDFGQFLTASVQAIIQGEALYGCQKEETPILP